jgi:hypothetical protein
MYPTKTQILKVKPKFRNGVVMITNLWKTMVMKNWKNKTKWIKIEELSLLILALVALHRMESPDIELDNHYSYDEQGTIHIDFKHPSIISTLHETAHYLFGSSELKACRWSVHLFKECFPSEYKKLRWENHMLVQ